MIGLVLGGRKDRFGGSPKEGHMDRYMLRCKVLIRLMLLFAVSTAAVAQSPDSQILPADYVSDRCSMFPDGDWGDCCISHDKAYFFGGTRRERRAADDKLYQCVKGKNHAIIANMMWLGVRVGGVSFLPTSFRWGFGEDWKKPTGR